MGGDPFPTRMSPLVVAPIDLSPLTQKTWLERGSSYGPQDNSCLLALAQVENFEVGEAVGGVKATETPPPRQPTLKTKGGGQKKVRTTQAALGKGVGRTW